MPKIVKVVANEDHTLEIELHNKHKIIYDMKPRLNSVRFCDLANLALFKGVKVEHENTLVWNDFCEMSINELLHSIEK